MPRVLFTFPVTPACHPTACTRSTALPLRMESPPKNWVFGPSSANNENCENATATTITPNNRFIYRSLSLTFLRLWNPEPREFSGLQVNHHYVCPYAIFIDRRECRVGSQGCQTEIL